jgi:hypothetical protein
MLHPRTLPEQRARGDLARLLSEWIERHDLTYLEALRCLTAEQTSLLGYALRVERHPDDPDKKADEA